MHSIEVAFNYEQYCNKKRRKSVIHRPILRFIHTNVRIGLSKNRCQMKTALERTGIGAAIQIANGALPLSFANLSAPFEHVFCQNIRVYIASKNREDIQISSTDMKKIVANTIVLR